MDNNILTINSLYKSFDETKVLNDINISFKKGSVTSIIGPSGSGKSTLLRCINQLEAVTSGEIHFHDTMITDPKTNLNEIRSSIGMVFQSFNLFDNLTVLDNCTIGPIKVLKASPNEAKITASNYLEKVGMLEFKDRKVSTLSGGQKQRVAIARTLTMSPEIILFDEPTSALDPEMVYDVLDVIKHIITPDIMFIVVTHEMEFAKDVSDRIIFMDHGRIVETGSPNEIFNNPSNERLQKFINRRS
jgi:putative lysine transport system ATP-binding protein